MMVARLVTWIWGPLALLGAAGPVEKKDQPAASGRGQGGIMRAGNG